MDSFIVDVPPAKEFRAHIQMTLHFLHSYLLFARSESFPYESIEKIIDGSEALRLHNIMREAGPDGSVSFTSVEMLSVYAAHDIANKILVSEYGEVVGGEILKHVAEDHHLKKFENYRDHCIMANNHMIKDIEIKMPDLPGLSQVKQNLEQLSL